MRETDLALPDGRRIHVYDTAPDADDRLVVVWHHGTPNIGSPPEPLLPVADRLGIRWVSFDRPGYGGSSPRPGRTIGSVAEDVAAIVDTLGVERFAVMGHSGGGSHALGCGAALGDRVLCVVSGAGLAPFDAAGLDWFAGMADSGVASLRAAAAGRAAKERHEASDVEYDPEFTAADLDALNGPWSWLPSVVGPALATGNGGLVDDDLAYVSPWGGDPATVHRPVLLVHGEQDWVVPSSHSQWLAERCPTAELWLRPADGHISVLTAAESALEWLREHAG